MSSTWFAIALMVEFNAICNGTLVDEPDPGVFACSFSNGVLSWNDQGASRYFVRAINGGQQTFVGASTTLSLPVSGNDDAYLVRYWDEGVAVDAICEP